MDFEPAWLFLALPAAFGLGWLASRMDLRQMGRDERAAPRAYFKGLGLLLSEQQDKAIDAFIEAAQSDPDSVDLHFALGGLFRRRGEFERAVRVHEHLVARADLSADDRKRARHALAQDFMRAGLFDRAEAAFQALHGGRYDTEARMALLTLYERSRDWPQAIATARGLESAAVGSFAHRVAHYECERAQEAQAGGHEEAAEEALAAAQRAAPDLARPWVSLGQRRLRAGHPEQALQAWARLRQRAPGHFPLVADDYARAAVAAGQTARACADLEAAYAADSDLRTLRALEWLATQMPDHTAGTERLNEHLRQQPSLSAVEDMLQRPLTSWREDTPALLRKAVQRAAAPLQRYRCAACGFEARQYFWQCPGCQGWDTFPPRQLEAG
jgi:lipopolysaccharide biosynthesis regulator YciM